MVALYEARQPARDDLSNRTNCARDTFTGWERLDSARKLLPCGGNGFFEEILPESMLRVGEGHLFHLGGHETEARDDATEHGEAQLGASGEESEKCFSLEAEHDAHGFGDKARGVWLPIEKRNGADHFARERAVEDAFSATRGGLHEQATAVRDEIKSVTGLADGKKRRSGRYDSLTSPGGELTERLA